MDDLTYEIFAYSTDFYQLILQLINFTFLKKVSKIYMLLVELVKLFSNPVGFNFRPYLYYEGTNNLHVAVKLISTFSSFVGSDCVFDWNFE